MFSSSGFVPKTIELAGSLILGSVNLLFTPQTSLASAASDRSS